MLPPFHGERMRSYEAVVEEIVEAEIDSWPLHREFPIHARMQAELTKHDAQFDAIYTCTCLASDPHCTCRKPSPGLLLKAVEASGTKDYRGVQANVGEVLVWRNMFWALSEAMVRNPKPWENGYLLPDMEPGSSYHVLSMIAYTKVKYIIEQTVASGLIYINSSARDFQSPEIRPYLDKYLRGSNGYTAVDRVKLMKLLWDCLGTEFGARFAIRDCTVFQMDQLIGIITVRRVVINE